MFVGEIDLTSVKAKKINELVLRPKFSKYNAIDKSFTFIFIARFPKY